MDNQVIVYFSSMTPSVEGFSPGVSASFDILLEFDTTDNVNLFPEKLEFTPVVVGTLSSEFRFGLYEMKTQTVFGELSVDESFELIETTIDENEITWQLENYRSTLEFEDRNLKRIENFTDMIGDPVDNHIEIQPTELGLG